MLKKLLITPGVILGVLSFFYLAQTKEKPKKIPITERAKPVRVLPISMVSLTPRAVGFGYVQPEKVWKAIAEVGGKIVEIHPNLKKGVFLNKGELLFRIRPDQSQFAVEKTKADILNIKAQVAELDQNQINTQRQLEIEERSLEINQKELKRKEQLFDEGVISKSELDKENQRLLIQRNVVENYKGVLNRIPSERRALGATLSANQSRLGEAQIDLEKTIIKVPFPSRVSQVNVEQGQAANVGQTLATTDSVEVSEIEAQIPRYVLKNLVPHGRNNPMNLETFKNITRGDEKQFLGFKALVRLDLQGQKIEWKARFSRIAETDPKTGAIGVVVAVDDPYLKTQPGRRPPLQKNMYCEVELFGKPLQKSIVIPRSSLYKNYVYLINSENRLEKRQVVPGFYQGNLVTIESGLQTGEQLVVSDLVPAIDGMLLAPQIDEELLSNLIAEATFQPEVE